MNWRIIKQEHLLFITFDYYYFFFRVDVLLPRTPSVHENVTKNDPDTDTSSDSSEVFLTADEGMRQGA